MNENIMNATAQNETTETEKKALDLSKVEKMFQLPANLPYPKDIDATLAGLPELKHETVAQLLADFDSGKIVIPGFQRAEVWDEQRKKALEFSVTHNFPVPPIMLVKAGDKLNLDDGQQRLKALKWATDIYAQAIRDIEAELAKGKASEEAKANIIKIRDKAQGKLEALGTAKVAVMIFPEMEETAEKYAYAALNNGKTHSGSEWGRAFIPAMGLDFVQSVTAQTKGLFGKKSVDFALYFWAAMGGDLKKTPAGKKVFPVVRRLAETKPDFVFPEIPADFASLISAIDSRPQSNNGDYCKADFCKPGFIVPMIQGIKHYGEWDMKVLAYAIRNLDKFSGWKVAVIDKPGKGKNGPVMSEKAFSNWLSKSGSGESLTWKKAQAWAKLMKKCKKEMEQVDAQEEKDEMLSELEAAVAEMESGDDE